MVSDVALVILSLYFILVKLDWLLLAVILIQKVFLRILNAQIIERLSSRAIVCLFHWLLSNNHFNVLPGVLLSKEAARVFFFPATGYLSGVKLAHKRLT